MREYATGAEMISGELFTYGIAVSNVANKINPAYPLPLHLNELIKAASFEGIGLELQIEFDEGDNLVLPQPSPHQLPFLGVHTPIGGIDFLDPSKQGPSLVRTESAIKIACDLEADYLVAHLTTNAPKEWDKDRLSRRGDLAQRSRDQFEAVAESIARLGFKGEVCIENLEFSLFPATSKEILELVPWLDHLREIAGTETGFALDLAHLLHTGLLLELNMIDKSPQIDPHVDEFARGEISFDDYLRGLIIGLGSHLKLVHITGANNHETHDMPNLELESTDRRILNLRESLHTIRSHAKENDYPIRIINEAHGHPYGDMIARCQSIQAQFR